MWHWTIFAEFTPLCAPRRVERGNLKRRLDVSLRGKILNFMGGVWCVRKEREGRGKTVWCVCCEFKAGWVYSVSHSQITPGPCVKALSGNVYPRCLRFKLCLVGYTRRRAIRVCFFDVVEKWSEVKACRFSPGLWRIVRMGLGAQKKKSIKRTRDSKLCRRSHECKRC